MPVAPDPTPHAIHLLRLTLADGVGPILGRRLLAHFGSAEAAFGATPADLERVRGIGDFKARHLGRTLRESAALLEPELDLARRLGVTFIALGEAAYPALLAQTPDAPLILSVRGRLPAAPEDFCVAIVGSRHCTAYGIEQAERFAGALAQSGLVIVSGGARGIDSAAHRATLRARGRTVAVLGCGLAQCYPPENADLFAEIAAEGGSIVSELPLTTSPAAENFPARNRVIAGLSLGALVIEAPVGSGALITARVAAEEYGREVMAVPGRIDSPASTGSNKLIQSGAAAMVSAPQDVIDTLESAARHQHAGTHALRFGDGAALGGSAAQDSSALRPEPGSVSVHALSASQHAILESLAQPMTLNDLCRATRLDPSVIQSEVTILEIRRLVYRDGHGQLCRRD